MNAYLQRIFSKLHPEAVLWLFALLYLAVSNPFIESAFTLCPLKNLGFQYCPGCGLGRSVSFLLHGELAQSLQSHILGIPATMILLFRAFSLLSQKLTSEDFSTTPTIT